MPRPPKLCFVNKYFEDGLRTSEANIYVQPVFSEYKARTHVFQFLKI